MVNDKAAVRPKKIKKTPITDDELKKILDKYEFVPDFIPNIRKLLKENQSIHNLKVQKMRTT
jgi:hypothetical protein